MAITLLFGSEILLSSFRTGSARRGVVATRERLGYPAFTGRMALGNCPMHR
jgi:hypothetical protein